MRNEWELNAMIAQQESDLRPLTFVELQLDGVQVHLEARDNVVDVVYVRAEDVHEEVGHRPRHRVVRVRAVRVVHGQQRLEQALIDDHAAVDGAAPAVALVGERGGDAERHLREERRLPGPEREARDPADGHGDDGALGDARGEAERVRAADGARRADAEQERAVARGGAVRARGDEREDLLQRERRAEELDERLRVVERLGRRGARGARELHVVPRELPGPRRTGRRKAPGCLGEAALAVEHERMARHRAGRERLPDRGGRGRGWRSPPRPQVVAARAEAGRLRARTGLAGAGRGRHWHWN
jgi:hypothetical protein